MGGVVSGIGAIASPIIGSLLTPGPSGTSPAGSLAAGFLTQQRPQAQQYPGAYYPQPGQGAAYNYIPTGQPATDIAQQQLLAYQSGAGLTAQQLADPMLATLLRNQMNDPTMAGVMPAAQQAAAMYGAAAPGLYGAGQQLGGAMMGALPQFQNILAMGTDPQGALYQRTLQQLKDQMGGQMAQTGLSGTGPGVAMQQQGLRNFNIDWQNQQLNRALSALQGYGGAMAQVPGVMQGATGLEQAGAQAALQAGQIPFQASQGVMGQQAQDLAAYLQSMGGAQGIGAQDLGAGLSYLQTGLDADRIANALAAGQAQQAAQQSAAAAGALSPLISSGISGIGQGLGQLYNSIFGGPSGGTDFTQIPTGVGSLGQLGTGELTANFLTGGVGGTDWSGAFGGGSWGP